MNIGKLDTPVTIRNFTTSRDEFGGVIETWNDWKTVWGSVSYADRAAGEAFEQGRTTSITIVRFTFRTQDVTGLKEDYRIICNSEYYNILDILNFGRKNYTTVKTEKKY